MKDFTVEVDTPWMARILDPSKEHQIELGEFDIVNTQVETKPLMSPRPRVTLTFKVASVIFPHAVLALGTKEKTTVSIKGGITMMNPGKNITEDLTEYVDMDEVKIVTTHVYDSALRETEDDDRGTYLELSLYPKTVTDNRAGAEQ